MAACRTLTGPALLLLLLAGPALTLLTVLPAPGAGAQTFQDTFQVVPHQDLLFTDISETESLLPLGETGFAAATRGGLVLWPGQGEGARQVLTRTEGMPSNVVWSLALTEAGLLVGTEFGLALVQPGDPTLVDVIEDTGLAGEVLAGHVFDVEVVDGAWYAMDRDGGVAVREAGSQAWLGYDHAPGKRAHDLLVHDGRVLVSMDEDGVWELDPAAGNWTLFAATPAPALRMASFEGNVWVGQRNAGFAVYDANGNKQAIEVPEDLEERHVVRFRTFGDELWMGTNTGVLIYDPDTRVSSDGSTVAGWRGISPIRMPHGYINDLIPLAAKGAGAEYDEAVLATPIGVADPVFDVRANLYALHRTFNGPATNQFTGMALRQQEGADELWIGTNKGADLYYPDDRVWWHVGRAQGLNARPVFKVDHQGEITWLATQRGTFGLDRAADTWRVLQDPNPALKPGNIVWDVEADGNTIWMPQLGNGLLKYNLATNGSAKYQIPDGLLSHGLTCAERWHEFLAVCSVESFQLFNLTLATPQWPLGLPYDFCRGYACGNNYLANHTFDAVPDGPRIWTATLDNGIYLFERDADEGMIIAGHWNEANGLPADYVRAVWPTAGGAWAGTARGLALVDIDDGVVQVWDRSDGLDDTVINSLYEHEGVLYVGTLSGLYRLDIDGGTFLPLVEQGGEFGSLPSTLRISYPPTGTALKAPVNMTGIASVPLKGITAVEVQVADGPWLAANGTETWGYRLPVDEQPRGPMTVNVRVRAGDDVMATTSRTFVNDRGPGAGSLTPPGAEHDPPKEAVVGQTLSLPFDVRGEAPLAATLEVVLSTGRQSLPGRITGGQAVFDVEVPSDAVGDVAYRIHVQSGAGDASFPDQGFHWVPILEPRIRRLGVQLVDGEPNASAPITALSLSPGEARALAGWITNDGNRIEDVRLSVSGLRPTWLSIGPTRTLVPPGQRVGFEVDVSVPDDANPGSTVLLVNVQGVDGGSPTSTPLTITVPARAGDAGGDGDDPDGNDTPFVPAPVIALTLPLVALALARARGRPGSPGHPGHTGGPRP